MQRRVVVVAPPGPLREALLKYLSARAPVVSLEREALTRSGRVVLTDDGLLVDGVELLRDTLGALVFDSGRMWSVPLLAPGEVEWAGLRGRFDQHLRDERESASLWFSLLEVLNAALPACINSQAAFAREALIADTLLAAANGGLPVAPLWAGNAPDALEAFAARHEGPLLSLPWDPQEPSAPLPRSALASPPLQDLPTIVVAPGAGRALRVVQVAGEVVEDPERHPAGVPDQAATVVRAAAKALDLGCGTLTLSETQSGWQVVRYRAVPDLAATSERGKAALCEALWQHLRRLAGARP